MPTVLNAGKAVGRDRCCSSRDSPGPSPWPIKLSFLQVLRQSTMTEALLQFPCLLCGNVLPQVQVSSPEMVRALQKACRAMILPDQSALSRGHYKSHGGTDVRLRELAMLKCTQTFSRLAGSCECHKEIWTDSPMCCQSTRQEDISELK